MDSTEAREYLCETCGEWGRQDYCGDVSGFAEWEDALSCPFCEVRLGENPQRRELSE
jgi:hypothetical protein